MIDRHHVAARLREIADKIDTIEGEEDAIVDIYDFSESVIPSQVEFSNGQVAFMSPKRIRVSLEMAPVSEWEDV